jgi:tetratricopeptide (TPR) repeat protein
LPSRLKRAEVSTPPWFPTYVESLIGLRQAGPEKFEPVEKTFAQVQALLPAAGAGANEDFPRLARWKLDHTTDRHGMPRFVSTLANIIDRRVEERSVDALMECYEAISVDPLVLAALSLYLPNPRQGEYIADLALKIPNTTPLSRCFAASTLVNAGRSQEAKKIAEQAVAEAPNDVRVLRRVAKLEARISNTAAAFELFERALKLQPDNPETYRAYGWVLYNSQQYAKAGEQFGKAETYAGDTNEDLIAGLCLSAQGLGKKADAQAAYARLIALDPEWRKASHLTALTGWTQQELHALEQVRQVAAGNR